MNSFLLKTYTQTPLPNAHELSAQISVR